MKQQEFTTIIIEAEEGNFLTQAADVEPLKRIISPKLALGCNDSAENWREITSEEAAALREQIADAARTAREAESSEE